MASGDLGSMRVICPVERDDQVRVGAGEGVGDHEHVAVRPERRRQRPEHVRAGALARRLGHRSFQVHDARSVDRHAGRAAPNPALPDQFAVFTGTGKFAAEMDRS